MTEEGKTKPRYSHPRVKRDTTVKIKTANNRVLHGEIVASFKDTNGTSYMLIQNIREPEVTF